MSNIPALFSLMHKNKTNEIPKEKSAHTPPTNTLPAHRQEEEPAGIAVGCTKHLRNGVTLQLYRRKETEVESDTG